MELLNNVQTWSGMVFIQFLKVNANKQILCHKKKKTEVLKILKNIIIIIICSSRSKMVQVFNFWYNDKLDHI